MQPPARERNAPNAKPSYSAITSWSIMLDTGCVFVFIDYHLVIVKLEVFFTKLYAQSQHVNFSAMQAHTTHKDGLPINYREAESRKQKKRRESEFFLNKLCT